MDVAFPNARRAAPSGSTDEPALSRSWSASCAKWDWISSEKSLTDRLLRQNMPLRLRLAGRQNARNRLSYSMPLVRLFRKLSAAFGGECVESGLPIVL